MKRKRRREFTLAVCFSISTSAATGIAQPAGFSLAAGERLTYHIEYMAMEIASIQFTVLERIDTLGTTLYHVRADVNSNPKLPFVTLRDRYESYFDRDFRSYYYTGNGLTRKYAFRIEGVFDYEQHQLHAREFRSRGRTQKLHKEVSESFQTVMRDGLSLFYLLRSIAVAVPPKTRRQYAAFVGFENAPISFERKGKRFPVSVENKEFYAIPAEIRFGFEGLGGIKGRVKLNYSADGMGIPLSGEIKAPIGTVKIRLGAYEPGKPTYTRTASYEAIAPSSDK